MKGQVTRVIGGFYDIYANKEYYRVRGAGILRYKEQSPVVGDFVEFEPEKVITDIFPRKNQLIRPKVANVDQVVVITSIKEPDYNSKLLNKLLSIVEYNDIKPILIFTKKDLSPEYSPEEEYKNMGYQTYSISNNDLTSLNQIQNIFTDKLSVFTGQTGAGKSTTISNLANVHLDTQEISKSLGRGKHTTRVVEIIPWYKGWLIDTPGFSSFDVNLSKLELAQSFYIFRKYMNKCKFRNCSHVKEVQCGIKDAVAKGYISIDRYDDFVKLYNEVDNE